MKRFSLPSIGLKPRVMPPGGLLIGELVPRVCHQSRLGQVISAETRTTYRSLIFGLLGLPLLSILTSCTWQGVLKQDTVIGWGGRAIAVTTDPKDDNFVLAASPTGGVFESALGGSRWGHVDAMPEFGCFDIRFNPNNSNIIIATTIEDSRTVNGGGIWLSIDHGKTWTHPPTSIVLDAAGNVVPQSAFGISFRPHAPKVVVGTDHGIAISNDYGVTWTYTNPTTNAVAPAVYSVLALANGRIVTYGDAGIWMSDNGLDNWYQDADSTAFGGWRIANALAVSPLNPNDVFFTDDFTTLLYSNNGGRKFNAVGTSPPTDAGIRQPTLRIAGQSPSRSKFDIYWARTDGLDVLHVKVKKNGALDFSGDWNAVNVAHSDPTDVAFSHVDGKLLYVANDGGVEQAPNNGGKWSRPGTAANHYDALQIYDVKVVLSDRSPALNDVYFGTQDNDLFGSNDSGATWPGVVVPEGGRFQGPNVKGVGTYTQVHFNDQGTQIYGPLFNNVTYISFPFNVADTVYFLPRKGFVAFEQDVGSGTNLWVSQNGSTGWSKVSGVKITQTLAPYAQASGPVINPSLIVPFKSGGSTALLRVDNAFDGVANNETVTPVPMPVGASLGDYGFEWLPSIVSFGVDPNDPDFIILPDVGNNEIFITSDGGKTWIARDDLVALITDNGAFKFSMLSSPRGNFELSTSQVSAIAFDPGNPNRILIGTAEAGIVYSNDHGATWSKIQGSERVPNITSFAFLGPRTEAYASTWGRGLWTVSLDTDSAQSSSPRPPTPQSQLIEASHETAVGNRRVRGDVLQARQRFSARLPTLEVTTPGRHLPRGVVISGQVVEVTGHNWKASASGHIKIRLFIDGKPVAYSTTNVSSDGRLSARLPASPIPSRHLLEAKEFGGGTLIAEAKLVFSAVLWDRRNASEAR